MSCLVQWWTLLEENLTTLIFVRQVPIKRTFWPLAFPSPRQIVMNGVIAEENILIHCFVMDLTINFFITFSKAKILANEQQRDKRQRFSLTTSSLHCRDVAKVGPSAQL